MKVLNQLLDFVLRRKARAFLVGGFVRDLLSGRERYDIDVSVLGDASSLARAFGDEIGGAFYVMDEENDVARVILKGDGLSYLVDMARVRGDSIDLDLSTRDFTVNAMALDISGGSWSEDQLIDPFGGREDLEARRLRAVASSVFDNDPVRLLRAVRFEAALGFGLDARTESYVRRDARKVVDASSERVRDEFFKIVAAEGCVRNLRRLDDLGLLQFILPEVTALKGVTQSAPHSYDAFEHSIQAVGALEEAQLAHYLGLAEGAFSTQLELHFSETVSSDRQRGILLRFALLLHDTGKQAAHYQDADGRIRFLGHEETGAQLAEQAMRRLRFSNEEIDLVASIVAHHLRPIWLATGETVSDRAIYRFFRATGGAGVDVAVHAWCDHQATYGETAHDVPAAELQAVIARLLDRYYHAHDRIVDPPRLLDGREVMKTLGIAPGPLVGDYLDALREAQATGEVITHEEAVEFIKRRNEESAADDPARH